MAIVTGITSCNMRSTFPADPKVQFELFNLAQFSKIVLWPAMPPTLKLNNSNIMTALFARHPMSELWYAAASGNTDLVQDLAVDKHLLSDVHQNVTLAWIAGYNGHVDALFALRKAGAHNDHCELYGEDGTLVASGTVVYVACRYGCSSKWEDVAHLRSWWNKAFKEK